MAYQAGGNDSNQVTSKQIRLVSLAARITTVTTLLVSIIVLKMDRATVEDDYKLTYSYFGSYSYMFYISVIGLFYNFVQIPFAIFYFLKSKRLLNQYCFIQVDFYSDKITSFLIATATGAAFAATFELSKLDYNIANSKYKSFFDMALISVIFLLVGFLSSAISSVISSLALPRKL